LTDLMSGLAVMFLLIAAIFMVQSSRAAKRAKDAADAQRRLAEQRKGDADELDRLRSKDRKSIDRLLDLKGRLEANTRLAERLQLRYDPDADPFLLTISFTDEKLQFPPGACEVGAKQESDLRVTLAELFPELCKVVASDVNDGVTQTIAMEGHTDRTWPLGARCGMSVTPGCATNSSSQACQREAFENNVRLSARRAQYVFFQAREALRDTALASCLDDYFVIAGRGQMSPLDRADPRSAKNRRVEIKVRVMAARPGKS
jgi:flagellar motor protein MotB